jgi:uncharacterized tellurite resistance protein B-like protein
MLSSIREFFERHIAQPDDRDERAQHSIELATAALLIETIRSDSSISDAEREAVLNAIRHKFSLDDREAEHLIRLAEDEVRQAVDHFQFTSLINREFTQPQKIRVIELMWQVALVDADINAHERHLVRKVADLLHVTHPDMISAKLRAQRAAGR